MEVSYSLSNQEEDDDLNSYNISAFDLNFITGGDCVYSVDELNLTSSGNKSELAMEREEETDNEALSSLLMLSKANADADLKSSPEASNSLHPTSTDQSLYSMHHENCFNILTNKLNHSSAEANGNIMNDFSSSSGVQAPSRRAPATERSMRGDSAPLSKSIKLEHLRKFFHLPIVEVARQLGTCTTALKKICRRNRISKWPYRQIKSITKSIQSLEMASLNDALPDETRLQYRQQIVSFQTAIDDLIKDPNSSVDLLMMGVDLLNDSLDFTGVDFNDSDNLDFDDSLALMNSNLLSNADSRGEEKKSSQQMPLLFSMSNLHWPKPSDDVTQIMKAASRLSSQTMENEFLTSNHPSSSSSSSSSSKNKKRSSASDSCPASSKRPHQTSVDVAGPAVDQDSFQYKPVEIGNSIIDSSYNAVLQRLQFVPPIQLAPLQRKRMRPNMTHKLVPLMEPDIGNDFNVQFIPQFVSTILRTTLNTSIDIDTSYFDMDSSGSSSSRHLDSIMDDAMAADLLMNGNSTLDPFLERSLALDSFMSRGSAVDPNMILALDDFPPVHY